jgi:hypothetical protein
VRLNYAGKERRSAEIEATVVARSKVVAQGTADEADIGWRLYKYDGEGFVLSPFKYKGKERRPDVWTESRNVGNSGIIEINRSFSRRHYSQFGPERFSYQPPENVGNFAFHYWKEFERKEDLKAHNADHEELKKKTLDAWTPRYTDFTVGKGWKVGDGWNFVLGPLDNCGSGVCWFCIQETGKLGILHTERGRKKQYEVVGEVDGCPQHIATSEFTEDRGLRLNFECPFCGGFYPPQLLKIHQVVECPAKPHDCVGCGLRRPEREMFQSAEGWLCIECQNMRGLGSVGGA